MNLLDYIYKQFEEHFGENNLICKRRDIVNEIEIGVEDTVSSAYEYTKIFYHNGMLVVRNIYLPEEYQNKGFATKFFKALQDVNRFGISKIKVETVLNLNLRRLLINLGYFITNATFDMLKVLNNESEMNYISTENNNKLTLDMFKTFMSEVIKKEFDCITDCIEMRYVYPLITKVDNNCVEIKCNCCRKEYKLEYTQP